MSVRSFWVKNGLDVHHIIWSRNIPKHVYANRNRFYVQFNGRSNRKYIGSFPTVQEAVAARDAYLSQRASASDRRGC